MRPVRPVLSLLAALALVALAPGSVRADLTAIAGTAIGPGEIDWSWTAIGGATNYEVFDLGSGFSLACTGSGATLNYSETGLKTNTAHGIIVQPSCSHALGSSLSKSATVYTLANPPGLPSAPFTAISASGFKLNWTANGNPAADTGYFPNVTDGAGGIFNPFPDDIFDLSWTAAGLSPNTQYSATVEALNGDGAWALSTRLSLGSVYTYAAQPANAAVAGLPGGLRVSWGYNSNPNPATKYVVTYTKVINGQPEATSSTLAPEPTASPVATTIGAGDPSTLYLVTVAAKNHDGVTTSAVAAGCASVNGAMCLPLLVDPTTGGSYSQTIPDANGQLRQMAATIAGGTFVQATTVVVAPADDANSLNRYAAFSLAGPAGVQPKKPITISFEVLAADYAAPQDPAKFALARWNGTKAVPLVTSATPTSGGKYLLTAQTNHLSNFIVVQTAPSGTLAGRVVRPNPLRLGQGNGFMTFDHLPANTRVRIFTLRGQELFDQRANASGMVQWSATNLAGVQVGSGIYLAILDDGLTSETMKLVVLR